MVATVGNLKDVLGALHTPAGTTISYSGDPLALGISGQKLANFPVSKTTFGDSFVVLSSGDASHVTDANTSGSQGTDLGVFGVTGDTGTITLSIPVLTGAKALSFDFTFLSEEYPEFVGSSFNDFFSAKLNGKEIALDTKGNTITVNNNFFDGSITPTGTFFDGQTPALTATAPVPAGAATVTLQLQVGDVGDGIYDSAAFIGNVHFAKNQVVYLDFSPEVVTWNGFIFNSTFSMPGFSATQALKDAVITQLNTIYKDFLVEYTLNKPTTGDFSTVYIGGDEGNTPSKLGVDNDTLGLANNIDKGNSNPNDVALVFTKNFTDNGLAVSAPLLAQVIAHESGHLFGLRHVLDSAQLMYPIAQASSTVIGGSTKLAEINNSGTVAPVGGLQDSHTELANNLGLVQSSIVTKQSSFLDTILNQFNFNFSSLGSSKLYDPEVGVYTSSGDAISFVHLADLTSSSSFGFTLSVAPGDSIIFAAKSDPNGDYNIFSTNGGSGATGSSLNFGNFAVGVPDSAGTFSFNFGQLNPVTQSVSVMGALSGVVSLQPAVNFDILGSPGDDTNLTGSSASESIAGLAGNDIIKGLDGDDVISGGDGNDVIDGGSGNDTLSGDAGSDSLFGGVGNDVLNGGADGDSLSGGAGTDAIDGGDGSDVLDGGTGNDTLTGGAGDDRFIFSPGSGADIFTDFAAGFKSDDKIDLTAFAHLKLTDVLSHTTQAGADAVIDLGGGDTITLWNVNKATLVFEDFVGLVVPVNDFNADSRADILWQNANGTPAVWLMNGTSAATFGPALANSGPAWHEKAAADFSGDGKADILWQNDNGTPAVWLMNGTNVAAFGPALVNPGPAWHVTAAADFNGDGKADILWQNDNGTPAVWLMDGTGLAAAGPALVNPGPAWHEKAAADFNGDGKADILWQNDNGTAAVWLMDGTNVAAFGPALTNPGPAWHATAAGDFNGDGKADILWQNDNGTPAVWLMNGTSALVFGPALANPGSAWHEKAAADSNGDGKADILWQNDNGTPAVWLMDGANVAAFGPALANPGSDWHII
jgi:Ca2+-binding RTX toxin-like protein